MKFILLMILFAVSGVAAARDRGDYSRNNKQENRHEFRKHHDHKKSQRRHHGYTHHKQHDNKRHWKKY